MDDHPENLKNIFDYFRRPFCILNDFNFHSGVGGWRAWNPDVFFPRPLILLQVVPGRAGEGETLGSTVSLDADRGTLVRIRTEWLLSPKKR